MKNERRYAIVLTFMLIFNLISPFVTPYQASAVENDEQKIELNESVEGTEEDLVEEEAAEVESKESDQASEEKVVEEKEQKEEKKKEEKTERKVKKSEQIPQTFSAGRDLSHMNFIDKITADKAEVVGGNYVTLKATYSEKQQQNIKAGDYFVLDLAPDFQSNTGKIDLNGMGTCVVESSKAVCTFNSKVEEGTNNKGYVELSVFAKDISEDEKIINTNLNTDAEGFELKVTKGQAGGVSPFEYKAGYYQDDSDGDTYLTWNIGINMQKKPLSSDYYIEDKFGEGYSVKKEDFIIYVGENQFTIDQFHRSNYGIVHLNESGFEATIFNHTLNYESVVISYKGTITDGNIGKPGHHASNHKNTYASSYQIYGEDPVHNDDEEVTAYRYPVGGGGHDQEPGSVKIMKKQVGLDGDKTPLSDVKFKLFKAETNEEVDLAEALVTNKEGITIITDLELGSYYFTEVSAPDFVDFDPNKKYPFEIESKSQDEIEIEVDNHVKTLDVSGKKTWKDTDASKRPEFIEVELYYFQSPEDHKVIDTKKVTKEDNWEYTFKNLPEYNDAGEKINYKVREIDVPGYESEVSGYDITNVQAEQVSIKGEKIWVDGDGEGRPSEITLDLYANGKQVEELLLTEKDALKETSRWTYEFKDLPGYDKDGKPIEYKVKERPVDGYQTQHMDNHTISNVRVGEIAIPVEKHWIDNDNLYKTRPAKVELILEADGKPFKTAELTEDGDWQHVFEKLPKYDSKGYEIKYEVKEKPARNYETIYEDEGLTDTSTVVIVNKLSRDISVSGFKIWKDDRAIGERPEKIDLALYENGHKRVKEFSITPTKEDPDRWLFKLDGLPQYDDNGRIISYTVKEVNVPDGYQSVSDGHNVTNTRIGTVEIKGEKTWDEVDASHRPDTVSIELLANGEQIAKQSVSKATNWSYDFGQQAKYDKEGKEIKYEVKETPLKGYTAEYDGLNIKNVQKVKSLTGEKTWGDTKKDLILDEIEVVLLANDSEVARQTVSEKTNWTYTFDNLPVYDKSSDEIFYEVKEVSHKAFEPSYDGLNIKNDLVTTERSVEKLWLDDNQSERPKEVKVDLLADGEIIDEITLSEANNWHERVTELPKYAKDESEIDYSFKEQAISGYQASYEEKADHTVIKNVRTGKVDLAITKKWVNDTLDVRPDAIELEVYYFQSPGQHKVVAEKTLTKELATDDSTWEYVFKDLPRYDDTGKEFNYAVREKNTPGYEVEIEKEANSFVLTNTHTDAVHVKGKKQWADNNDALNERPEEIELNLFRNDESDPIKTVKVTAADNWTYDFGELPTYHNNELATYSVKESTVDGYVQKPMNNYDLVNVRTEKTSVTGEKTWIDNDNAYETRPESITVFLMNGSERVQEQEVKADANGKWTYEFTDLDRFDSRGKEIEYSVKESPVKHYKSQVTGTDITNTLSETMNLKGEKVWKDSGSQDRPESIYVQLKQNNKAFDKPLKVTGHGHNWPFEFSDLPKYDADGKLFDYTIEELNVAQDYVSEIDQETFEIVNTRSGQRDITVEKSWLAVDESQLPDSITVELSNDKTDQVITQELTKEMNWSFTFENLDMYCEDGKLIEYKVSEKKVPGFKTEVNGFEITNTQETTSVSGEKVWRDFDGEDRPEKITISLLADGEKVQEKVVTERTLWKYSFVDLPTHNKSGEKINYEIKESEHPGYTATYFEDSVINTKEFKEVSGEKLWDEVDSSKRPDSVHILLYKNGVYDATKEVTAADDWKYTFNYLSKYDSDGKEIEYTVKEYPQEGYEAVVDGYNIINKQKTTSVEGEKTWLDDTEADRPDSITVELYADGEKVDSKEVTDKDNWRYEFTDLPAFTKSGKQITYTIDEVKVAGYETSVKGYDLSNLRTGTTNVAGEKTWLDDTEADRPESITVELYADGEKVDSKEVTKQDNWRYEFTDLPAFTKSGKQITYTIDEVKVAGYETSVKGYDLSNLRTGTTNVAGEKTWLDDTEADRPESITVELYADGEKVDSKEVTKQDNWRYEFTDLPAFTKSGKQIVYTIDEVKVAGYETSVKGYDLSNLRTGTTNVAGEKTWLDDTEADRPESITVELYADGEKVDSKEVTKQDNWRYEFRDLPAFTKSGKQIVYTIDEVKVAGYETSVKGYDLTNTLRDPGEPEEPEEPGKPEKPEKPDEPGKPGDPSKPETPQEPSQPEDPKDSGKTEEPSKSDTSEKEKSKDALPSTATQIFNLLFIGVMLLLAGTMLSFVQRRYN